MVENAQQVQTDVRLVVIYIAGREDRDLARRAAPDLHRPADGRRRELRERFRRVRRQSALGVHAEHLLHRFAGQRRRIGLVHHPHDDRNGRELAHPVSTREQPIAEARLALEELARLGAKHQMWKIHVPGMRRNVGAFGHETDVAQIALVDNLPVIPLVDAIDFAGLARIDEIEQRRKRVAQADAAPAAVTDVEDARELPVERGFVVEVRIAPVERMPGGRFEAAFAYGHWLLSVPDRSRRSAVRNDV